jgi:hypothetical protein
MAQFCMAETLDGIELSHLFLPLVLRAHCGDESIVIDEAAPPGAALTMVIRLTG